MYETSALFFCYTVLYSFNWKLVIYLMLYFLWTLLSYCLEFLVVAFVIFILLFLSAISVTFSQLFSLFFIFRVLYIWPPGGDQFKGEGNVAVGRSLFVFHLAYLQSSAFSLISSSGNLAWLFTLVTWSSRVWRHSHLGLASLLVNKPICLPVIYASLPVRSFDLHAVT